MRLTPKIPRILKIEKKEGFRIVCMFNNGESRLIDFNALFNEWKLTPADDEYKLLDKEAFEQVELRNYTLSWKNIEVSLMAENGKEVQHPFEIDPVVLYNKSLPVVDKELYGIGSMLKNARKNAGLTQAQLARRCGTSRFYISRLENDKTDVELSTFRKIIEAGLGKKLRLLIE
jgi:DNA-binding XRE family transcriptional regulator